MESHFSKAESGVVEAMQGQPNGGVQRKNLGQGLKGKTGREGPDRRSGTCALLAQPETRKSQTGGTDEAQNDLKRE